MTIYGWDSSHYDGTLTTAILTRAKAEGISFFTHKVGEYLGGDDPTQGTALAAARDAGIQVVGGYFFIHPGASAQMIEQADECVRLANLHEPWWREFPGWFWQTDAETSGAGRPTLAQIKVFSDHLAQTTSRVVVVYASRGQYGDTLAGLGHPLWNAAYPSDRQAGFVDLYPGDSKSGWTAYSDQTPALWQYSSSATIAGRTTCDANAFRGTIDQLLTLIGTKPHTPTGDVPDMALTDDDATKVARAILNQKIGSSPTLTVGLALEHAAGLSPASPASIAAAVLAALPPAATETGATPAEVEKAVHDGLASLRLTGTLVAAAPTGSA